MSPVSCGCSDRSTCCDLHARCRLRTCRAQSSDTDTQACFSPCSKPKASRQCCTMLASAAVLARPCSESKLMSSDGHRRRPRIDWTYLISAPACRQHSTARRSSWNGPRQLSRCPKQAGNAARRRTTS